MLSPKNIFDFLSSELKYDFFAGVPDSTLKHLCACIDTHAKKHIICANEGSAVGAAIGYHLATKNVPVVYMQNSGFGNALNPLLSMASQDIYQIPMLVIIGYRGEINTKDEPQHLHQGRVLLPSMEAMDLEYKILPTNEEEAKACLTTLTNKIKQESKPIFLIVIKNSFSSFKTNKAEGLVTFGTLNRMKIIPDILKRFPKAKYFSSTGFISRELYQVRNELKQDHNNDFLSIGAMGHLSQMAYAYQANSNNRTICIEGDGSVLMHMGGLSSIKSYKLKNFIHIILNNGCHLSVGGQKTNAMNINLAQVAKSCGYQNCFEVKTKAELELALNMAKKDTGTFFIDIRVSTKTFSDLVRPTELPVELKKLFME